MKITKIEPIHLSIPYRYGGPLQKADGLPWHTLESLFVKVTTDEGLVGWGEAFGFKACRVTKAAVECGIAPLAMGRDPSDIVGLTGLIARHLHNWGRSGPAVFALSALDIALWDIAGQIAGQPLYRLLGATSQVDRVPAYASLLRYGSPALVEQHCAAAIGQRYGQIKLHEIDEPCVAAARQCIGPDVPLMLDVNCAWSRDEAVARAKALDRYRPLWLEEPVWPPEDCHGLGSVRSESGARIAAGENAGSYCDLVQLVIIGKVDYLQPSIVKIGGISEMMRAATLCNETGIELAPHSPFFGPGLLATVHVCASRRQPPHVERFYCDLESDPLGGLSEPVEGMMTVPQTPGLGVEIDEGVIDTYRVH